MYRYRKPVYSKEQYRIWAEQGRKNREFAESLYAGVRRGLLEVHEATDRMCGYLRCLCDMGMITENTRSKMYTDFVAKVLELETK